MSNTIQTSVVIIGGSIVGLSQAMFLAHWKVPCILIERHRGSAPHPRAIGWTHRTIELFRTVGLDKELPVPPPGKGGRPRRVTTKTLNGEWSEASEWTKPKGGAGPGGQPASAPQGKPPGGGGGPPDVSAVSPVQSTALSQDHLEPLIREKIAQIGGADLRLGFKMTEWSQDSDGVSVTAVDRDSGDQINIRADYLIACDGAMSRIRQDLNIGTSGVGVMRTLRSILFRCPSIDHYGQKDISQWTIEQDGFEGFMVRYTDGRWALMSHAGMGDALSEEEQKAIIRKVVGEGLEDIELITQGKWDLQASVADKFSSGRVFLAGDAAHALPPSRGGYGANTGIADAHNLAWKLAAVLPRPGHGRGQAPASRPSLLDTYDAERRPLALVRHDQIFARDDYKAYVGADSAWARRKTAVIDDIAMELGQIYRSSSVACDSALLDSLPVARHPAEWKGQPGTRAPHLKLSRGDKEISSLDLFGRGWVLLFEEGGWRRTVDSSEIQVIEIGSDVKELTEWSFEETFGIQATEDSDQLASRGAVLVRPDGCVAARWTELASHEEFSEVWQMVSHRS